jgi:DNA-binding SARP family transcriptional activator
MMSGLEIRLLGGFRLDASAVPLPLPATLKARSLPAYLARRRERSWPREQLVDLFWTDYPRDRALRNLSTAL